MKEYDAAVDAREKSANAPPPDFNSIGISAPDSHTIVIHLLIPTNYFLDLTSFPAFFPVHEASMKSFLLDPKNPDKGYAGAWTRPPGLVSNGPYQLTDWKLKQSLTLEPNPLIIGIAKTFNAIALFSKPSRKMNGPQLLAYQTGTVDILSFVPQEFGDDLLEAQSHGLWKDVHYRPVFGTYYYVFNCARPPFNDKRVRKALSLAIDRREIVDKVTRMHQKPVSVLVPPDSIPGYTSPSGLAVTGDLAAARQLLADAGFPEGRGFPSTEILYTTDVPVHGRVAQAIAQMWKQNLGINVTLRGLESPGFSNARQQDHDFDVARGGWYGDYRDPTTWLDLCRAANGNNDGGFNSPAFDALMAKADTEHDPAQRLAILHDAESILVNDELPLIPLYQYGDGYIYNEQKLTGCEVNDRLLTPFKYLHRLP